MRIALILVPYHLGHEGLAMGGGPDALLNAGAADALAGAAHDVEVLRIERKDRAANEIGASFELVSRVAEAVADAVAREAFPLVLAGNCLTSVGIVAGLGRDVGVVWLDAHADFNTPDTSLSGFADGMGLAILTGAGWQALRELIPGYRVVPEENVVLAGVRDVDPPERDRLDSSAIEVLAPIEAAERLDAALDLLHERVSDVHLHLDLDVLDPSAGRANEYASPGGLSADEVERVVAAVGERCALRSAALTAYDPAADQDGRIPAPAGRFMERIAAAAQARLGARAG